MYTIQMIVDNAKSKLRVEIAALKQKERYQAGLVKYTDLKALEGALEILEK